MTSNGNQEDHELTEGEPAPQFLPGNRQISLAALRERIEEEFIAETRPDILRETRDETARRDLIREVVDYVLTVESVTLSRPERLAILDTVYADLFNLGPLNPYLADEAVSEITVDDPQRVFVRRGAGDIAPVDAHFDDAAHLTRSIHSVLSTAGMELTESEPFLEVGAVLTGRPARLTIAAPPASATLHIEIRLHPPQRSTLAACVAAEMLDEAAANLLEAIIAHGHGLMIAGDAGTGKSTLLEALIAYLPGQSVCVERAAELRIPEGFERLAAVQSVPGQPSITFTEQITAALDKQPLWLALDEVRFDETQAMWQALTADAGPRCLWAFRGSTDPLRLRNAFSMSVRRAQPGVDQEIIHSALMDRLPFVALVGRREQRLKLLTIGEWQPGDQPESLVLRTIWPDGAAPLHTLT